MDESPLFSKLNAFFENEARTASYKKRSLVLQSQETPISIFYIKQGFVRAFHITEEGEELTLTILKPHDLFPLTYGINTSFNPYFLEAITPLEIWYLSQEQFFQFIKAHPEILYDLTAQILVRFNEVLTRIEQLVFRNAYSKVLSTLLNCAQSYGEIWGNDVLIKIPLTHRDIATMIGVTRETTSIEMKKLEKQGIIQRVGRFLLVKNMQRIELVKHSSQIESAIHYSV